MWAIILLGAKKFGGWIVAALSLIATFATIYFSSRKVGNSEAKAEASEQRAKDTEAIAVREVNEVRESTQQEVETIKGANDVKTENSTISDSDVANVLRNEWSRD